jgi:hypothetical protein
MRRWVTALLALAVSPDTFAVSPDTFAVSPDTFAASPDTLAAGSRATAAPVGDKKTLFRALKLVPFARRVPPSARPPVTLYNLRTREALPIVAGAMPAPNDWSRLLRCHFTGTTAWMNERLATEVVLVARRLGARRVEIISGYRDPKYNRWLRKKGREVARRSRHTRGQAVDFRLTGVPTRRVRDWLLRRRAFGVGYYPKSGFVHLDVGPVRQWSGR